MATIEVEKLIQQLEPKYLQDLQTFIEYLLFVQQKQSNGNGKAAGQIEAEKESEEDIPERLKIAHKYFDSAPKPHFPVSKYDVYEQ